MIVGPKFLDHCARLILLKKVGGGYIFIHRMLLEYFAEMTSSNGLYFIGGFMKKMIRAGAQGDLARKPESP
jgi:hypothetical protein